MRPTPPRAILDRLAGRVVRPLLTSVGEEDTALDPSRQHRIKYSPMIYRPCPTFPGYRATECGSIQKDAHSRIDSAGRHALHHARVLKRIGARGDYISIKGQKQDWREMVRDAWGDDVEIAEPARTVEIAPTPTRGRPKSDYKGGRVITLAEHWAELLAKAPKSG